LDRFKSGTQLAYIRGEGEKTGKKKGEKMMVTRESRTMNFYNYKPYGMTVPGSEEMSPLAEALEDGLPIFGPEVVSKHGKQHTPVVRAPERVMAGEWFEVEVEVGHYHPHPSLESHYIDSISLMVNGAEVANAKFHPGQTPKVTFMVKVDEPGIATIRGFGNCNLHGLWMSFPVEVEVL